MCSWKISFISVRRTHSERQATLRSRQWSCMALYSRSLSRTVRLRVRRSRSFFGGRVMRRGRRGEGKGKGYGEGARRLGLLRQEHLKGERQHLDLEGSAQLEGLSVEMHGARRTALDTDAASAQRLVVLVALEAAQH